MLTGTARVRRRGRHRGDRRNRARRAGLGRIARRHAASRACDRQALSREGSEGADSGYLRRPVLDERDAESDEFRESRIPTPQSGRGLAARAAMGDRRRRDARRGSVCSSQPPSRHTTDGEIPDHAAGRCPLAVNPFAPDVAISLDGRRLAYIDRDDTGRSCTCAMLDRADATQVWRRASNVRGPFFSPDGEWVALLSRRRPEESVRSRAARRSRSAPTCSPGNRGGSVGRRRHDHLRRRRAAGFSGGCLLGRRRRCGSQGPDHAKGEQGARLLRNSSPRREAIVYTRRCPAAADIDDRQLSRARPSNGRAAGSSYAGGGARARVAGKHLIYGASGHDSTPSVRSGASRHSAATLCRSCTGSLIKPLTGADLDLRRFSRRNAIVYVQGSDVQASGMTLAWRRSREDADEPICLAPP